jgi:hypothetical protein
MKMSRRAALLISSVILSGAALVIGGSAGFAQQDQSPFDRLIEEDYLEPSVAPTAPPATGVQPLISRLSLNGTVIEADDQWILDLGVDGGSKRNTVPNGELNFVFRPEVSQELETGPDGATFERRQSAWIFQLRSADRMRETITTRDEGGQLTGFNLDFSLTGRCFLPGAPADGFCTYTPGLATIEGGFDPDRLVPNAFAATTSFGEEITQDVHDSLKAPGFQRGEGVPGAPLVGLSFDIPNAGFIAGRGLDFADADRELTTQRRWIPSIAKIEQSISSNSREAAASRTTRAFVLLEPDEWSRKAVLLQLSALLLPSATSRVDALRAVPNVSISNNLFFALNNARVPGGSYTVFQTGRAWVTHAATPARSAAETPVAGYAGVWLGFSPVRKQTISTREQFLPQGNREPIGNPVFRQGGGGTPFRDLIDADFFLFDSIDQNLQGLNFQNIDDLFVQVGLGVTTQDAVRRLTTTETTRFSYVPHLSFNGNRTGGESVLRYYTGVLLGDETNAYVGFDYSLQAESGWNVYARADLYSAPDTDYYSEVELRASRSFSLGEAQSLTLGAGGVVALDGLNRSRAQDGVTFSEDSRQRVDFVGRFRDDALDYTLRQRFSRSSEDTWDRTTTLGVSYAPNDRLFLSAQASPFSTEATWLQAAAEVNWKLGDAEDDAVLQVQAARIRYDLGKSTTGRDYKATETTFRAGFKMNF